MPDRDQHRHQRQQRPDDRAEPDREEEEHEQDREVGELDAVRLEVVEQPDADDREAATAWPGSPRAGGCCRGCRARPARASSSEPGPVRKMMLNAGRPSLTVDACTSVGATSYALRTSSPRGARSLPPGTSLTMSPIAVSMLEPVSSLFGYSCRVSLVKSWANVANSSVNTSSRAWRRRRARSNRRRASRPCGCP